VLRTHGRICSKVAEIAFWVDVAQPFDRPTTW